MKKTDSERIVCTITASGLPNSKSKHPHAFFLGETTLLPVISEREMPADFLFAPWMPALPPRFRRTKALVLFLSNNKI